MTNEDEVFKKAAALAEFRFGLIAPVIQGLFPVRLGQSLQRFPLPQRIGKPSESQPSTHLPGRSCGCSSK